jgi:hypothetical protein
MILEFGGAPLAQAYLRQPTFAQRDFTRMPS